MKEGGGGMEVYLEITYLMNALLIAFSFELLCFLLNIQMKMKELFKYIVVYNISFLLLYIDLFEGFLLFYYFLVTIYFFRKLTYIYYPIFTFVYISLLSFIEFMLPSSTIFQCILLVSGFNFLSLFIMSILFIIVCYLYISFCQYKINKEELVDVSFRGKSCLGFIDNGNKVFYKGYPVIFMTQRFINEYEKIGTIDITTASQIETIDITMIHDIEINHQKLHHVYVGIMPTCEYDCILNSQLLGGLL